jgi:hypothetical protein
MPLIVKCKSCGYEHPSIYQMHKSSFEDPSVTMINHNEDSPQCENVSTYDKPDYSFIEVK